MPLSTPDLELVSRSKDGDIEAFGALYERYLERIYRYIRVRVAEETIAEDISENVFLRAYESIDRYQERGFPFSAYLYRIARNQIVDYYRKRKEEAPIEAADQTIADTQNLEDGLILSDQVQEILAALETLPEDYQEVIRLRVVLDMPTSDVAKWMNRSEGATRVLLHRALKAIREAVYE